MAYRLPQSDGFLPSWLLLVRASLSTLKSRSNRLERLVSLMLELTYGTAVSDRAAFIQCFSTLKITQRLYDGPSSKESKEVTGLSSRAFGTRTLLSACVRFYGVYHLEDKDVYNLVLWSFVIGLMYFGSEWLVFGTIRISNGLIQALTVTSISLIWMLSQDRFYIK